jgi:hypothetical protein
MAKITIDGKEYDSETLPADLVNAIVSKNEIVQNRIRHVLEVEKIDVLTEYYNDKIKKGLEEYNKPKKK